MCPIKINKFQKKLLQELTAIQIYDTILLQQGNR